MMLIVAHHCMLHGFSAYQFQTNDIISCINKFIIYFLSMGGKLGVNIFILITGYFMCKSRYKFSKAIKLYLTTFIYSALFLIPVYIQNNFALPSPVVKGALMPITYNVYRFISAYLGLYILIPFLNKFIISKKRQILNCTVIILYIACFIMGKSTDNNLFRIEHILWFIFMYCLGAIIRLEDFHNIFKNRTLINMLSAITFICTIFYIMIISLNSNFDLRFMTPFIKINSLTMIIFALFFFHFFKNTGIKENKIINYMSSSVLGVYLFHDNPIFTRHFLWSNLFNITNFAHSRYFGFYVIFCIATTFILGIIIDKITTKIFQKPINYICSKIDLFMEKRY